MLNRNSNAGTTADSSTQPKLQRPAKLLPNPLLAEALSVKPILFSTPMVDAIIAGRKTQTRRLLPEWCNEFSCVGIVKDPELCDKKALEWNEIKPKQCYGLFACFDKGEEHIKCKYEIGNILWVRETWRPIEQDFGNPRYEYKATEKINLTDKWKPSLFMPKQACRLFLEVTDIRAERLHEITGDDILCEGVDNGKSNKAMGVRWENMQRMAFEELWNKINKNWNENPYVWVISFKVVECPQGFC